MTSRTLYPKVLFFIAGATPTKEQLEAANQYGPGVVFRNASLIHPDGPIEDSDAVAGDTIPDNYGKALPNVSDTNAVKERMAKRDPNNATMTGGDDKPKETPEQEKARLDALLSRGQQRPAVNERQPLTVENRTTQAGTPRVEHGEEWKTKPETATGPTATGEPASGDTPAENTRRPGTKR